MKTLLLNLLKAKAFLTIVFLLVLSTNLSAATITITSNTNWNTLGATSADDIIVKNGATLTVNVANAVCNSIQLGVSGGASNGNGTLLFSSGSQLTVSTDVTVGNGARSGTITMTSGGRLICDGFNYVSGALTAGTGTIELTDDNTLPTAGTNFGIFNNLTITSGTTTLGLNTTIGGNLVVGNGSTLATTAALTLGVTGTTSVTGTLTLAGTGNKSFTGDVTLNSGAVWNETGVSAYSFAGNFTNNATTFTANTGVHTFSGTTKILSGSTTTSIPSVAVTGTYANNATLTVGTALSGAGTLTQGNSSALNIGGTSTITGLNASTNANTVNYTGAAQTVKAVAYTTLSFSGSGDKTIATGTSVSGNLTITSIKANIGAGLSINVGSLTLGTLGTNIGTWGSTTSGATYKNNTYFTATTGVLNVSPNDTRATPIVTPTIGTYTYTGLAQGPNAATNTGTGSSYTFSYNGTGGTTYGPSSTLPTNAGTYTVTVTVAASTDGFYKSNSSTATAFSIATRGLTITANNGTKVYGTTQSTPVSGATTFGLTGLQNGETIGSVTLTYGAGALAATDIVGSTSTITPSSATGGTFTASNYSITYTAGTLTVTAAPLTITADNGSKTYGQTYTVGAGSTAFTSSGLQNGETIGSITIASTGAVNTAAVGSYNIVPSAATGGTFTASNYNITYTNGNLTVNTAPLTITADNGSKTYGQTYTVGAGSTAFSSTGLQNGETIGSITIASTGAINTAAVGSYTIVPSSATSGTFTASNYNITYADGTLTVNQASLTITANNGTKVYGTTQSTPVTGATTFGSTGLQNGESIGSVTLTYGSGALAATDAVGSTSTITPSAATGGTFTASNYSISYTPDSGTLTVVTAPLTITADNAAKCFGTTYTLGSTAFSSIGLQNSETIGSVTLNSSGAISSAAAGSYSIVPSAATGGTFTASNYSITYIDGTLTVNALPSAPTGTDGERCVTGTVNLSATVNGGETVDWYDASSGGTLLLSNSTSYTTPSISSTTIYYAEARNTTTGCISSARTAVTATVHPTSVGGTVSSDQTICSGTQPANLTLAGHTGAVVKWQSSSDAGFTSPTDISNTSTTLTGATIGNLTANTYFRAVVQSGVCSSANSSAVLITIDAVSVGGTVSANQTICYGTEPANLTLSGNTGSVIKWQSSDDAGFTSPTDIAETSTTLDGVTIGSLTSDTYFRAVVQNGVCSVAYSASALISVDALTVGGSVSADQTICSGTAPSDLTLSGHTGSVIKWESSLDSGFTSPTDILVTSTTLTGATIGNLTQDTYFRAVVQNGSCEVEESAAVLISVDELSVGGTVSANQTICYGTEPANLTLSGNTGSVVKWQSSSDAGFTSPTDIAETSTTLTGATIGNLTANTYFRAVVQNGVCSPVNSASVLITLDALTVGGSVSANQTICYGTEPSDLTLSGHTGSVIKWESSLDAGFTSPTDIAETSTTLTGTTIGSLTQDTYFRAVVQNGSCEVEESTAVLISVDELTVGGSVSADQTICSGTAPSDLTLSGHTGSVIKWESSVDAGFTSPTDILVTSTTLTGATIGNLTQDTYFRAVVQNGSCDVEESDAVLISVDDVSVGGTVSANQTICYGTEPTDLTLSGNTGSVIKWQSSDDAGFTSPTDIAETSTTLDGITIGSLTTDTYFRAVVQNGVCSVAYSASALISVDELTVGGSVSADQTICSGTAPSDLTLSGHTGSVIKWESSLDGAFTSPTDILVTSTTLTGATIGNLTQDTYFRAVVQNGSCDVEESAAVLITVNEEAEGGSVDGGTAICSGSTSGLLTLTGYTGDIIRWEYSVSPFTSWTTIANTNDTYTSGTLTQTTQFRAVVQNGVCPEAYSTATSVDINTTTWSSGAWSNGTPDGSIITEAVIASSYTSAGENIDACSLTVNNGATVVISSGDTVTLSGALTAISGSFVTFNNNANLIQSGSTNTNSGAIIIKRDSSPLYRLDYTLWSSPVANQNIKAFSPGTLDNRFYTHDTATNTYVAVPSVSTTNFATAKGYLIRTPNSWPAFVPPTPPAPQVPGGTVWHGSFTGVPNNGDYSFTLVDGGAANQRYNLVGNPYPSPIDATAFVSNPTNFANTTATLYLLRKTNYYSARPSYSTWTTAGYTDNGEPGRTLADWNGYLQTGQGFFVEASGAGTSLVFDNSMRVDNHDNQFFKNAAPSTTSIERNRIWLNATDSNGVFSQTMVGYITNATQGVDATIDGKYFNDGEIILSSLINDVPYAIQGRSLPFDASDVVPLYFKVSTAGNYTIAIDHVDGLFTGAAQAIYLRDNLTTTIHDLNAGAYSFATAAGTFANRFEILYALPLGTENPIFTADNVVIYNHNDEFVVNTGNAIMSSIKVFDLRGRLLQEKNDIDASQATIGNGLANQVLLVQITSADGVVITKKVIR